MFLKNFQEDLVLKTIKNVFKDLSQDYCRCSICIEDIATYVLNRVRTNYIHSGRGILQLEKKIGDEFQDQADIYTLVVQAIQIINKRRKEKQHTLPQNGVDLLLKEELEIADAYYLNFPYIFGKVIDYNNLRPKKGAEIKLFIFSDNKYKVCEMKDVSWVNPYVITIELEGYFIFWPAPLKAVNQKEITKETVYFKISIDDNEYVQEFTINIISDKIIRNRNIQTIYPLETIVI